jgi:DeoR/GlpR family transcriptional regulator of sugar metabolism
MMAAMLAAERRQRIAERVRARGVVSIAEMAVALGTSEITIRRDLRLMAEQGLVVRTHGGAVVPGGLTREPPYTEKATRAAIEKTAIARMARSLIASGESVILGPGTTTLALALMLGDLPELTVVTNSLLAVEALMPASRVEVLLTGGQLRRSIHALVGPATEDSVRSLRVSVTFISGNGLTAERGLSTPHPLVAATDRALAAAATRVVVLADHTKIGFEAICQTVPLERMATLVTDAGADLDQLASIRAAGVEVLVATAEDDVTGAPAAPEASWAAEAPGG